MAFEVGTRAGKYELVEQLGAGGFGLVFRARDHELGRECALKVLRTEHIGNAGHVQRFLQEARAAARIQHPGIVTVFECGQIPVAGAGSGGMVYIAMEVLHGESLAARITRGALPAMGAIAIARQIASAVGAAHQMGIVHRDLKPENVYLVPDPEAVSGERVKVLDFGIAKLGEGSAAAGVNTGVYTILGSPRYMSPEQFRSTAGVDARADIYSLGVMLFEMLCGERPFLDPDLGGLIAKHQVEEPPRLSTKVAGLPAELDELVASMLAKSPESRPQSMEVVQRVLERARESTGSGWGRGHITSPPPVMMPAEVPPLAGPSPPTREPPLTGDPTQRDPRGRSTAGRWVVGGVLAGAIAVIAVVIAAQRGDGGGEEQRRREVEDRIADMTHAVEQLEARLPAPRELRDQHRATIARRDAAALAAALGAAVYAIGPDAPEVALGAPAMRALIDKHIDRFPIGPRSAPIGEVGGVAWWMEIGGDRQVACSTIAVADGKAWRVAVWKLAYLVPNGLAAKLAAAGRLPAPAEPARPADQPAAPPDAEALFRAAMSSRAAFLEAVSAREDAIATGTAPGELILGGAQIRAGFSRIRAEFALRGEIASGRLTDRAAWAAANIDYSAKGLTTQIFRVLALLLEEDGRWTIAMAHFSNAGPIGKP